MGHAHPSAMWFRYDRNPTTRVYEPRIRRVIFDPQGKSGVMIKVSCPSCNASYDVDKNRLPADGLRMRCPKCEESFQVHRDGSTAKAGGGAAPASKRPPRRKPTQVGLGPNLPPPEAPPPVGAKAAPSDLPVPSEGVDRSAPFQPSGK